MKVKEPMNKISGNARATFSCSRLLRRLSLVSLSVLLPLLVARAHKFIEVDPLMLGNADLPLSKPLGVDQATDLNGTSWQLVKFQGSDDSTITPDDKTKYTVAFGSDHRVTVRIDCNRGNGSWKSSGPK